RPLGAQQGTGVANKPSGDRKPPQPLAEDGDEAELWRVDGVEPAVERAAERREQAELVEAAEACSGEPAQLAEDALAGGLCRPPVGERDAPRAVAHRDREGRASRTFRVPARRPLRLAAGDVHVHDLPPEQPVADGAADDPGLLARQHLAG